MWRIISSILMGWSLGANDCANIFGTAVSSGLVKYRTAIILSSFFIVMGSVMEGEKCIKVLNNLAVIELNAAFVTTTATFITMALLTYMAIPASTSQAIVGAIIGWSILEQTPNLQVIYKILICWVLTPVGGIVAGWILYNLFNPVVKACFKSFVSKNRFFFLSVLLTGCYGAYSLGANNVANVIGVYVGAKLLPSSWAALIGGISISLGVLTYSRKVMFTVGRGIVPLDSFSAVISLLSEAIVLHIFTQVGIPVSSSQAIVGGVIGVGVAKDVTTVDLKVITKIILGWLATPSAAGILAFCGRMLIFYIEKML